MNAKERRKSSIFKNLSVIISLIISVVSISIALSVYLESRRKGSINVFIPSRYGILRGTHHSNTSDKVLLCFTLHNDGNLFRNIDSVNLVLTDESGNQWHLKAIGKFDDLKDLNLKNYSLISNPNYSLVTSISLDKNQFVPLNLLFYYEDDTGWTNSGKSLRFKKGTCFGRIIVHSLESGNGNSYRSVQYKSDNFEFTVRYEPFENIIDTFTDIEFPQS